MTQYFYCGQPPTPAKELLTEYGRTVKISAGRFRGRN
jgi:hypothetical protein